MIDRWMEEQWRSEHGRTRLFKTAVIASDAFLFFGIAVILYLLFMQ